MWMQLLIKSTQKKRGELMDYRWLIVLAAVTVLVQFGMYAFLLYKDRKEKEFFGL